MLEQKQRIAEKAEESTSVRLSVKALVIGLVVALVVAWNLQSFQFFDAYYSAMGFSGSVPSISGMLVVFIFLIINWIVRRFAKKDLFKPYEMAAAYIIVMLGTWAAGTGYFQFLYTALVSSRVSAYGTSDLTILKYYSNISELVIPTAEHIISPMIMGMEQVPWNAWIMPIVLWTLFGTSVFLGMFFLASIVRKEWTEYEQLQYPLAKPIAQLCQNREDNDSILGSKVFWFGFAVSFLIVGSWTFSSYFPFIPHFPARLADLSGMVKGNTFLEGGFNLFPGYRIEVYPLVIGIMFFVPTSISLTAVLFYHLDLLVRCTSVAMGIMHGGYWPRVGYLPVAMVAFGISGIVLRRHYWLDVLRTAFGGPSGRVLNSDNEFTNYRTAVVGLFICMVLVVVFLSVFMGVSVFWSVVYTLFVFSAALGLARVRAETGAPMQNALEWIPENLFIKAVGIGRLGSSSLAGLSHLVCLHFGDLSSGMALALESSAIAEGTGLNKRSVLRAGILVFVLVIVVSFVSSLLLTYDYGWFLAASDVRAMGQNPIQNAINTHVQGTSAGWSVPFLSAQWIWNNLWNIVSLILVPVLLKLHATFVWWPFHPIGYILGTEVMFMSGYWFAFLIAGLTKWAVFRYGGPKAVKKVAPAFTGLIVGYVIMRGVETILSFLS